jgi:hypothetical protein
MDLRSIIIIIVLIVILVYYIFLQSSTSKKNKKQIEGFANPSISPIPTKIPDELDKLLDDDSVDMTPNNTIIFS